MVHEQCSFSLKLECLTPCTSRALVLAWFPSSSSIRLKSSKLYRCGDANDTSAALAVPSILIGLVERTSFRAWTSSMAINENGHIAETDGNKVHHQEEIVIVGGGLGALCFAAALHRLGLRAVVLEKSDRMRSEGTAIVLWTNAMHILEVLDLADQFRSMYINLPGQEFLNSDGKRLITLDFSTCEGGPHEMHSVERKVLLEAFAGQIPQGTIRLNSQMTSIKKSETSPDVTNSNFKMALPTPQRFRILSGTTIVQFDGCIFLRTSKVGAWAHFVKTEWANVLEF